jgi:hypothetical protein
VQGTWNGDLVAPAPAPTVTRRQVPVQWLPRAPRGFVDRTDAFGAASRALADGVPVVVGGEPGIGKSALLRALAHQPWAAGPGGLVHRSVHGWPLADVLQYLFDACWDSTPHYLPPAADLQRYLAELDCTFVLDDVALDGPDAESMLDLARGAGFVLASTSPITAGEVESVELPGLAAEDALVLLAARFGRGLDERERSGAVDLVRALGGVPARVVQAADAVRAGRISLAASSAQAVSWAAVIGRDPGDARLLGVLAALPRLRLRITDLQAASGLVDTVPRIERLVEAGLVIDVTAAVEASPVVGIAPGVATWLSDAVRTTGAEALRSHLLRCAADPWRELGDGTLVSAALQQQESAAATGRWQDAVRLGHAVGVPLVLAGRWGAWERALSLQLTSARAAGDERAQAHALHQLGTRALCLGLPGAGGLLRAALDMRLQWGDEVGAQVTRHNLNQLASWPAPVPPQPRGPSVPGPRRVPTRVWQGIAAGGLVLALALGGVVVARSSHGTPADAIPTPTGSTRGGTGDSGARAPGGSGVPTSGGSTSGARSSNGTPTSATTTSATNSSGTTTSGTTDTTTSDTTTSDTTTSDTTTSDTTTSDTTATTTPHAVTFDIPSRIEQPATNSDGAVVTFRAIAVVDGVRVLPDCNPPSGYDFPVGTMTVKCTAGGATQSFDVTIDPPASTSSSS